MQRGDKRPLSSTPSFFPFRLAPGKFRGFFPKTCLQCSEWLHHPPCVSPLCCSSNNTPGTRSLVVTAPNPSFHSTDFWIKEGRFPHLWIVLCYGAHASFHASFLPPCASKWKHFLIYTDLERFWKRHWRLEHGGDLRYARRRWRMSGYWGKSFYGGIFFSSKINRTPDQILVLVPEKRVSLKAGWISSMTLTDFTGA